MEKKRMCLRVILMSMCIMMASCGKEGEKKELGKSDILQLRRVSVDMEMIPELRVGLTVIRKTIYGGPQEAAIVGDATTIPEVPFWITPIRIENAAGFGGVLISERKPTSSRGRFEVEPLEIRASNFSFLFFVPKRGE